MTDKQLTIIKSSWRMLRQVDPVLLGDVFYTRLFAQLPFLKTLFKAKPEEHYKTLIDMIGRIIARVNSLDELALEMAGMAQNYINPSFKTEHYRIFNEAFLWTLEKGLGNDWNDEVKNAWRSCFQSVQMPD